MPSPPPQRLNKALALCLLLLLLGPAAVLAFSSFPLPSTTTPQQCPSPSSTPTALSAASTSPDSSSSTSRISSRREWLTQSLLLPSLGAASLGLFGQMGAANAAADPAKAGTKDDPAYQKCLANCMYFCTKPKGEAQKSRAECLPGCKEKCAQTKAQTMLGVPKG